MTERIQKKELLDKLAVKMSTDVKTAETWLASFTEILFEAFVAGQSVTIPGLGGFYLRPEKHGWVFKFNPGQKLRSLLGWSSTFKGKL
jgi:nucleoid DNA-binding protein